MNVSKCLVVAVFVAAGAIAAPAFAHHSFAMFDNSKTVVLDGTVKELQWTNPHIWVQVMVKDASGKDVEWSIEGSSPNGLARRGWKRTSLKPGDKVTIVTHPLKNGEPGGSLVEARLNGAKVGD